MIRDGDVALAGDDYPELGCEGPPWRDVDGDGNSGFEESGRIRTRDELQARIDLANLAGADAFVSIHINSPTEGGQVIEVAFGQTFYDDETPWGPDASANLADAIQRGTVAAIDPLTTYTRQDRGTEAVAYYAISRAWADGDTCETRGRHVLQAPPRAAHALGARRGRLDLAARRARPPRVGCGPGCRRRGPVRWADRLLRLARDRGARRARGHARGRRTSAGCRRRAAVLAAGRPRRTDRAAGDEHRDRCVAGGLAPRGRLGGLGRAVPRAAAGGSPADRSRDPGAWARENRSSSRVELLPKSGEGRELAWISLSVDRASLADRGSPPALQLSSEAP